LDALSTFLKTRLDCLVLGPYLIEKEKLNSKKLKRITAGFNKEPINYQQAAKTLKHKGFLREAIENYKKSLNMSVAKSESDIYFNLGQCYYGLRQYKDAIAALTSV
jgi:tetratricopeptide (TPR) repeat protein